MYLIKSLALNNIKKIMGQNNHFLITCLVGLDIVANSDELPPPSFSPQWRPQNQRTSALRSREYLLNLSLAWIIDCLDGYFYNINRKPNFIESEEIRNRINSEDISKFVFRKLNLLGQHLDLEEDVLFCLAHLAIAWRNRVIHSEATNDLKNYQRQLLLDNSQEIQNNFSGLVISDLLDDFDQKNPIKQKGASSFCKAIQDLIYEMDRRLMDKLDLDRYMKSILNKYLRRYEDNLRLKWSKSLEDRTKVLETLFKTNGFTSSVENISNPKTTYKEVTSNLIEGFANKTIDELLHETDVGI